MPLRVLADENIPLATEAFGTLGSVRTLPGRSITPADVRNVDVLLVRSVTSVDDDLLADSSVRFVGSATIGTDHVDRDVLQRRGIAFAHAPASNADSVADYVVSSILHLGILKRIPLANISVGIIGVGNIGGRIARRAPSLGLDVLLHDPPRQEAAEAAGASHDFVSFDTILSDADVITLHVPLTTDGPHPTYHLVNDDVLRQMTSGAWLLNTSRGAVVDNEALRSVLHEAPLGATVLDVWEDEPTPDVDLLRRVDVATPHVAGYAYDGKVRGTQMLYDTLCDVLDRKPSWSPDVALAPDTPNALRVSPPDPRLPRTEYLHALAQQMYDVTDDDARLRPIVDTPPDERGAFFSRLRKTYPKRREMQQHVVPASAVPDAYRNAVATGLGVALTD